MVSYREPERGPAALEQARGDFVGRWQELAQLTGCLDETLRGGASAVLIEGDAGIGKTRLIKELQALALSQDVQVCYGRSYEDLALPYLPFVDSLLTRLQRVPGADLPAIDTLLHGSATVARAVPAADADYDRLRAFLAVSRATISMARVRPLLLILDDLHWADQASLDLLGHLVFAAADEAEREPVPLMIVGAHRPVQPDQRLARTLARLQREAICRVIALSGLNERETEELIRDLGLTRSSHQLLLTIAAATGGNPLFIQEVVAHLTRSGALVRQGDALTSAVPASDLPMPAEVREAIRARVDGLSAPCRWALTRASLVGDSVPLPVLSAISGLDQEGLLPLLEEGIAGRFVLSEGEAISFVHPLVRRVFASLPIAARRRRLHQEIATALERVYGADADEHLLQIAHHALEAGDAAPAAERIHYARRAGERALAMFAWSEAARFYDAAVAAAEAGPHLSPAERADLHFWAGFAHYRDLDPGPASSLYERAIEGYRAAGDVRGEARALLEHTVLVLSHGTASIGSKVDLAPLDDVLERLGDSDPPLAGRLMAQMSEAYFMGRQETQAREASERALAIGLRAGDELLCTQAGFSRGLAEWQRLNLAEALSSFDQARQSAQRSGDLWAQGWPLGRIPYVLVGLGRIDDAEVVALEACDLGRRTQDWAEYSLAVAAQEAIAVAKGGFDAAERLGRDAMVNVQRSRYSWGGTLTLLALASCRVLTGAWEEAEDAVSLWITPGQVYDDPGPFLESGAWLYRQLIRTHAGDLARVRAEIAANPQFVSGRGRPDLFSLAGLCALAEIAAEIGEPSLAERPFEALQTVGDRGLTFTNGWLFFVPRVAGVAAWVLRQWDPAERSFQDAIATATRAGARPELGRTYLDYARMLTARGERADRRHAVELLRNAIPIFSELGMEPFMRRGVALADTLEAGIVPPQLPPPRYPDGLTDREGRVLLECARGRTDRQIAAELLISPTTIARSIAGIESKTGAGRDGAAAYAAAHGLLTPHVVPGRSRAATAPPREPAAPSLPAPLTVILFSDITGSTATTDRLGDARWMEVLRAHNAIIDQQMSAQGGTRVKHTGDGIIASFSSASGAIACAVAVERALSAMARELRIPDLAVRIGINAGEPVLEEGDIFGASVVIAQRICRRAPPGGILVSETVRELARGKEFGFAARGRVSLKGFPERFRLYEVLLDADDE